MRRSMFTVTLELLQKRLKLPGQLLQISIDHKTGIANIVFVGDRHIPEGGQANQEFLDWPEVKFAKEE